MRKVFANALFSEMNTYYTYKNNENINRTDLFCACFLVFCLFVLKSYILPKHWSVFGTRQKHHHHFSSFDFILRWPCSGLASENCEFSSFFLSVCVLRSKILMLLSFATILPTTVSLQSTNKHLHQIQTPQERTCRTCVAHQLIWPPGVQGHHPDRLPTETEFRFSPQNAGKSTYLQDIQVFTTKHWQINKLQIRQTYKRFKRTIFIRTKHTTRKFLG